MFPILAHQGGWDEVLLVAGPLSVIGLLLYTANRRVNARLAADPEPADKADKAAPQPNDTPSDAG